MHRLSVPLPPIDFRTTAEYHDSMETTVTLDWNPPQGSGPEAIIDNYTIYISPTPPYQPATVSLLSRPWNVTLAHNVNYTLNLTARNCAGESDSVVLYIGFSELAT